MRSLPAVQWRAEQAGPAVEVLRVGKLVDEGEVVECHGVRLDVEAATLELGAGTQVDHRADADLAQHREVGLGQLAQAIGPEEGAPTRVRAVTGLVATKIAKVDRALQRDHPVNGLCHVGVPPRFLARPHPAVCTPGRSAGARP